MSRVDESLDGMPGGCVLGLGGVFSDVGENTPYLALSGPCPQPLYVLRA
jgi:hypothetical protein